MDNRDILTIAEAAKYCGVTQSTVSRWISAGRIKAAYTGAQKKRARFISRKVLEDFFNKGV